MKNLRPNQVNRTKNAFLLPEMGRGMWLVLTGTTLPPSPTHPYLSLNPFFWITPLVHPLANSKDTQTYIGKWCRGLSRERHQPHKVAFLTVQDSPNPWLGNIIPQTGIVWGNLIRECLYSHPSSVLLWGPLDKNEQGSRWLFQKALLGVGGGLAFCSINIGVY